MPEASIPYGLKALSVRQPWAWAIFNGKDIENRSWQTKVRGRVLIHASMYRPKQLDVDDFNEVFFRAVPDVVRRSTICGRWCEALSFERGGIVGEVEIVDCVTHSNSPWFFGPYGFVLRNARPLPFRPCKGRLGFFEPKFEEAAP